MLQRFIQYVDTNQLFKQGDRILLAVSGGMDSMVMCELFHQAKYSFGIAHCNFKLRDEESNGDQAFVEQISKAYSVPFYTTDFDTKQYAHNHKISTQMAARDLRYEWFQEILKNNKYDYIATAHHKDDQVETLFINLMRGTGISGLHGILPKQKNLIRPLIDFSRKQIEEFVVKQQLNFREDSSNASDKYLRNKIRHQLIPVLEEMNDQYLDTLNGNIHRFQEAESIYSQQIQKVKSELLIQEGAYTKIQIAQLNQYEPLSTYTYEILKDFGFSFAQTEDVINSFEQQSGKRFASESHELLKDRNELIIKSIHEDADDLERIIQEDEVEVFAPIHLKFSSLIKNTDYSISSLENCAQFDYDKVKFPLRIRRWKKGDSFKPLGCDYKKKLSDFFIDRKFTQFEKENCYLLVSGKDIMWIIGHQIDHRYRITSQTNKILQIDFVKE